MREIPLSRGKVALVDDADYEWLNQWKWYANQYGRTFYAVRSVRREDGSWTTQYMHALIAGTPAGFETAHINGDGLDNRRSNLLSGTTAANQHGFRRRDRRNKSGFRGVSWNKEMQKWQVHMQHEGHRIYLGLFKVKENAASAFDIKARELGWPEEGMNFPKL